MLGSPASPRKRPFELLSDLVDDGGLGEDLHPERWDVSALDEMARYTRLGLGVGGELLAGSEEAVLMGRWGRSREEEEEEGRRRGIRHAAAPAERALGAAANRAEAVGQDGGVARGRTVEVYQVAQEEEEEEAAAAAGLALEHCSEEHNYSLSQGEEEAGPAHTSQREEEAQEEEESQAKTELEEEEEGEGGEEEEEEEEYEEEEDDEAEETAAEAELSSSSETECGESRSGV